MSAATSASSGHGVALLALLALPLAAGALACAAPADVPPAPVVADAPPATVVVECAGAIACESTAEGGTVLVDRDNGAVWYVAPAATDPAPMAATMARLAACIASPAPAGYTAPTATETATECAAMVAT